MSITRCLLTTGFFFCIFGRTYQPSLWLLNRDVVIVDISADISCSPSSQNGVLVSAYPA